ncbi:MAG: nuclear transport factor 2 family protein [Angustibacter sp.]
MSEMTEARLRDFFHACNDRDIDRVASFFAPDAAYLGSIGPDDDGTSFRGQAEVRRGMGAFLHGHRDLTYADVEITLAGDRGFATWIFTGTRLDGRSYSYRGVDILTFDGGLISRKDAFRKERAQPIGS